MEAWCVEARLPDLILLDILMPDMDGFEVCAALKAESATAEIPVIFLSANDDKNTIVRAMESGVVDFVTKPFNKAELLARVRTHLELKKTRDKFKELVAKREEFIGIMAHDLKNPLAGVQFSAQLLVEMKEKLPSPADKQVESIADATERTVSLITDFLGEFRDSQTNEDVDLQNVELVTVIDEAVQRFGGEAARKAITIHWEAPDHPVPVTADLFTSAWVFDDLLSNSLKFTERGRNVTIKLDPKTREVSFQDEGPGIRDEDRDKLFQPCTRLSAAPTEGEMSTGLGLSIAKRLSDLMKANLRADENCPTGGACFTIQFTAPES